MQDVNEHSLCHGILTDNPFNSLPSRRASYSMPRILCDEAKMKSPGGCGVLELPLTDKLSPQPCNPSLTHTNKSKQMLKSVYI